MEIASTLVPTECAWIERETSSLPVLEESGLELIWSASGTIELPEQPANLAWGGRNNSTLYITAATSVHSIETSTQGFVPYE